MIKRTLSAAAVFTLLASPAFASHCPVDVAKIDAALQGDHGLDATQEAQVKELRDKGENLHNSGDHGAAIENLHEAMEILGLPDE